MLEIQLCLTICNPMDCSPPGSWVHGILQAIILEWVAMPFSYPMIEPRSPILQVDFLPSQPPRSEKNPLAGILGSSWCKIELWLSRWKPKVLSQATWILCAKLLKTGLIPEPLASHAQTFHLKIIVQLLSLCLPPINHQVSPAHLPPTWHCAWRPVSSLCSWFPVPCLWTCALFLNAAEGPETEFAW